MQDIPRPIRLWYAGPQFRYEQPQAGRYREFRQIGVELLGVAVGRGRRRGSRDALRVPPRARPDGPLGDDQLHSEGRSARRLLRRPAGARPPARLGPRPDDRRRLEENPLRLFDSKDPETRRVLAGAPADARLSRRRVADPSRGAQAPAPAAGVRFSESASIVRGIDYYTLTVFEVTSDRPRRPERDARRRALRRSRRGPRRPADSGRRVRDRRGSPGGGDDRGRPPDRGRCSP